jgi:hypothetical protein
MRTNLNPKCVGVIEEEKWVGIEVQFAVSAGAKV